jgi:hypothetical protein
LAGIIISAVCNTRPRQRSIKAPWIAFLVAWLVSTLVWLAHTTFIDGMPLSPTLVGLTLVSVTPVAFVISIPGRTDVEETALRAPGGIQRASYAPGLAVMIHLFRSGPASVQTAALSSSLRS